MRCAARRLAALAALALWSVSCGVRDESAAPHVAKADALIGEGKLDEAQLELRSALEAEPKNADVNFRLAQLLHRREQIPDAVFFYEEALRIDPGHADAALALAFLMLGDDRDYAQKLIDGVLERDPKQPMAWVRRSDLELARGDADAALSAALTAADLAPELARVQLQTGLVHRARIRKHGLLGEAAPDAIFREAVEAFTRASEGEDDSPDRVNVVTAWVERANTLASWPARAAEATQAYREAVEAAKEAGGSLDAALDGALAHARRTRDAELLRWALERGVEAYPARLTLWSDLARAADAPGAAHSETLARLIQQQPRSAAAHALYARDLAARGRIEDALAHLDGAASKVRRPERVWFAKIDLALRGDRPEVARAAADVLTKQYAGTREARLASSEMLARAGDPRRAADEVEQVIDEFGASTLLLSRLAELRLLHGDAAAALAAAERGLAEATTPTSRVALLRIQARAQMQRGANEASADSMRRVAEITGGRVAATDLVPYAQVLYRLGRKEQARALVEKALAIEPPPIEAVLVFARAEGPADPARAEALLAAALAGNPGHPQLLEEAARFDVAAGRADRAMQRLQEAIAALPDYAPLHVMLARIRLQTGDAPGAIASAEEALRLDSQSPNAMTARVLVAAYHEQGKAEEAVSRLRAADAAGKLGHGGSIVLARLLSEAGEDAAAIAVLEKVVAAAPTQAGPKNDLAYLLVTTGRDLDRALSLAQEARAALPHVGAIADTLGSAYLAKQLPDAALPQFDEAISLASENSAEWGLAQLHRAEALHKLGRPEEAAIAARAALAARAFPGQQRARELVAALEKAAG